MATRKQSDMIDRYNAARMPPQRPAGPPQFSYTNLSSRELIVLAEGDSSYGKDLLFTELTRRLTSVCYPPKEKK